MSEFINNVSRRKEALKEVIQRLHAGETVESLKEKFGDAIRGATAGEIADAERAMIGEGIAVSEIQRLCDLHVAVFRETLDEEPAPESLPGHPVFTFRMENEVTMRLLESMGDAMTTWIAGDSSARASILAQTANLKTIEKHYSGKKTCCSRIWRKKALKGPQPSCGASTMRSVTNSGSSGKPWPTKKRNPRSSSHSLTPWLKAFAR